MSVAPLENNNFVAPRAPLQPRRIAPARTFHQNLHALVQEGIVSLVRNFVHLREQTGVPLFAHFHRHLVFHGRGGRIPAGRIFEDIRVIEFHFAGERQRLFEILFGFARETNDDVGG